MNYATLAIVCFLFSHTKPDDVALLETTYNQLSGVYQRYLSKRGDSVQPIPWKSMSQPINMMPKKRISNEYDFIIVGSGSAGSVIANRLSEISDWRILLLEAGKGENLWSRLPLAAPTMAFTPYNWNYLAEYQHNMSLGFEQHRMLWPRGKALGGTSVINFMIYTRGNKWDFERWAAQGNPGWSYKDILKYYMKSENSKLKEADYRYHGNSGYWSTEDIYRSELVRRFVEAGQELGLSRIDYNANVESFGISPIQANVERGRRHTVARAFLHPVRQRPNLHILTSAFVTKVLIDPNTKSVYGVEYERGGRVYKVKASKEVILSAGTFNSAQLLMLAGIGPKEHLQELGIPLLQDLPVGRNLHDHLTFPGLSFLINRELSLSAYLLLNYTSFYDFFVNGKGPYTSLGGVEGIAYIKTELSQDIQDIPDIELLFMDGSLNTDYGLFNRRWMNIRDDIYNTVFAPTHNIPSWTVFPMLLHPKSTGYLKLRSTNPRDYPLLYGNYFTDPEQQDINTFVASIRYIQRLARTRAFQEIGSQLNPTPIPGCDMYDFDSDDYWRCALRSISVTLHHQVGTVKMGPPHDPTSVVNHELKVYGVKRLRVSDCSVIPFAVGAHTNAVAVMVGEKTADIIKENWGKPTY
ncbi:hypothetical protein Zmor_008393 [Zophobas morio]|uniref:Glucose-methanol-choline oxidoreductase N-terminal domain-containing protein n=2 Tax=Zophobas morio TaxID=2755281 RepID=A0AA38MMY7_9CUCU|nr:hypothetical protein Zmor_008393 [Zophobas morio]